ncbi:MULTISPECIES: SusC/RagA family TonB-linked outer membrane protein [unclassified Tenacibaculum]|uniref:SusC/RagA family TonB-linked outer membrane protein n=1 Tax=unclassified Tenacibaculum TaxID=2635139 RepID=UPI001F22E44C|nr:MULTISPECIES: SusC/RagA family TonB-linked outer membrane protein [unclassified Tenacibaculum]MCF2875130.1 SusC/RagA family TonB-linked outer membrane protein [Tenacibaculum sp. Cn5-1]MCF2935206.1 SusC/RagA family TonB-linked outer membrane protein [Tenacibaculum sp. Cn5-34]MCG7511352.1 SusC/RagA family TonB-linked outer membrane protein [Tenacibaculum sp. Cn5-46]
MKNLKLLFSGILLLSSITMFAQQTVTGKVTEKDTGEPLPGVSIIIKGTIKGIDTDFNGNYSIQNVKPTDVLIYSFIGLKTKEVLVGNQTTINVSLENDNQNLDEVVVVGYGTTTVKDATGSVEAITAKDFTKGNVVTPENLLSGRVSGVEIKTSGAPGSGSQITIRGGSSITASNSPLIVIDGLPIEENSVAGSRGVLANINPNDIESFSVLKDASATAIYGSRASNGVIIITTKKGKRDFTLDLDYQFTYGEIRDRINVFSADAFRSLIQQRRPQDAGLLGSANTNWQNEIFRTTGSSLTNLTAKGQIFGAIPTRLSLGFASQEGNILTSNFDRKTISLSMNPSLLDDHLKINLNYNRNFEDSRFGDAGQIGAALRYDPTQPVYDASSPFGGFYQHRNGNLVLNGTQNPVAALLLANSRGKVFRHFGNLNLDYKLHFFPDLRAVINVGFDKAEGQTTYTNPYDIGNADETLRFAGINSSGYSERSNQLLDGYLNYTKKLEKVNLDVTAGYSYQKFKNFGGDSGNTSNPDSFATTFADPNVVNIGFFGRVKVDYLDKYLLTLNYRRDGTSRFSSENRWGDFGGAALAWKISEEDFLKDSEILSNLKLRVSYGLTGQQNLPGVNDVYLNRYRFGNQNSQFQFANNVIKATIPSVINPNLKWEETATLEFGIDYGLFNNRFDGSLNYFNKKSTDLLFNTGLPDGINFSNQVIQNVGDLEINGIEFTFNGDILKTEDINWNFTSNATYLDRKITALANNSDIRTGGTAGGTGNTIQLLREGFAPNSFYVFKQLYNSAGKPIEGSYADLNGDGIINDNDRYLKENPAADLIFGFQSNFNYKNFDLSFNLRANIGNYVYNNVNSARAQYALLQDNAVLGNVPTSVLATDFVNTSDVLNSDIFIENASFLRMDNITIGYTFNRPIKKFSKNSIRIWAGMQNVFTITNYSGLDPEVFGGIDNTIYPRPRNFLIGTNIKF